MHRPPRKNYYPNQGNQQQECSPKQPLLPRPDQVDNGHLQNRNPFPNTAEASNFTGFRGRGGGNRGSNYPRGNRAFRNVPQVPQHVNVNPNYVLRPMPNNNQQRRNRNHVQNGNTFQTDGRNQGSTSQREFLATREPASNVLNNQEPVLASEAVNGDAQLASQMESQLNICFDSDNSSVEIPSPLAIDQPNGGDEEALIRPNLMSNYESPLAFVDTGHTHNGQYYAPIINQQQQQSDQNLIMAPNVGTFGNFGNPTMYGNPGNATNMNGNPGILPSGGAAFFSVSPPPTGNPNIGNPNFVNPGNGFVIVGGPPPPPPPQPMFIIPPRLACYKCGRVPIEYLDVGTQTVLQDGLEAIAE